MAKKLSFPMQRFSTKTAISIPKTTVPQRLNLNIPVATDISRTSRSSHFGDIAT